MRDAWPARLMGFRKESKTWAIFTDAFSMHLPCVTLQRLSFAR